MGFGDRQTQWHERQTRGIREGGHKRFGALADRETQEEEGGSQPGSDPRKYISKITGKCAEGRLGAGRATEGYVQGVKGRDTGFQGKACACACASVCASACVYVCVC